MSVLTGLENRAMTAVLLCAIRPELQTSESSILLLRVPRPTHWATCLVEDLALSSNVILGVNLISLVALVGDVSALASSSLHIVVGVFAAALTTLRGQEKGGKRLHQVNLAAGVVQHNCLLQLLVCHNVGVWRLLLSHLLPLPAIACFCDQLMGAIAFL